MLYPSVFAGAPVRDFPLVPIASRPLFVVPSWSNLTSVQLSRSQKVVVVVVMASCGALWLAARYLRRRRHSLPGRTRTSALRSESSRSRKHKPIIIKSPSGETYSLGSNAMSPGFHRTISRTPGSVCGNMSERGSVASSVAPHSTVANSVETTPQQLGVMGMESLGNALKFFEDALAVYSNSPGNAYALTTQEESEFVQSLQTVIEGAYALQDQCEHLFLHQHSVLFRDSSSPDRNMHIHNADGSVSSRPRTLVSASSMESFVSAHGDIADLRDLEEFDEKLYPLYMSAVQLYETDGIPYREVRTEEVHCATDVEYVCKVHCIRLACQLLFTTQDTRDWFADAGRQIVGDLLMRAGKDPKDALIAYDSMLLYLQVCDMRLVEEELRGRGVAAITFYDVLLDFILLDAFEDLEKPPSSVTAVVQNRWLSNGFKESALSTAVWSVLKAKRRLLKFSDGFIAHFYDITEHLSPVLAWGFLGPDEELHELCTFFKDQVMSLLTDMFSFTSARYTTVEELAADLLHMTHHRFQILAQHFAT